MFAFPIVKVNSEQDLPGILPGRWALSRSTVSGISLWKMQNVIRLLLSERTPLHSFLDILCITKKWTTKIPLLDDGSFSLLEHLEANLTSEQSVEKIADHFSQISQEYPALSIANLSQSVQNKLSQWLKADLPYVSRYKVENVIRRAKKTKSGNPVR